MACRLGAGISANGAGAGVGAGTGVEGGTDDIVVTKAMSQQCARCERVCGLLMGVEPSPRRSRGIAVALGAALVAHSATAGLAIPGRRHPLVQAVIGTTLAL